MKKVKIIQIEICDADKQVLPQIPSGAFIAKFSPTPLGSTEKLFFKILFEFEDKETDFDFEVQAKIKDSDFYSFAQSKFKINNTTNSYKAKTSVNPVFLTFKLNNKQPLPESILATINFTANADNTSTARVNIKGQN